LAYAALVVYVAFLFVRPQEWVPGLIGLPVMDAVVGLALITWLGSLSRREWRLGSVPQNWFMLGLFLATLLSHASHRWLTGVIETFRDFGKVTLLYFLIVTLVNSVQRVKLLILVMAVGCLFLAAHGMLQASSPGHAGFGGSLAIVDGDLVRVRGLGIFHDPNDLALMLVVVLPFLLSHALFSGAAFASRLLGAAAAVPITYCIYLTNSRGGWLALGVMLVAFLGLHLRSKGASAALAVLVLAALVVLGPSRLSTISTEEGSAHGRMITWGEGNRMLKQFPLFGIGYGLFAGRSELHLVAHNSFVHCWAELGLFGYFFWLGLILASMKDGLCLAKAPPDAPEDAVQLARLGRAGLAGLMGFLAAAFFLSRTYTQPLYVLLGLFAAFHGVYEQQVGPLSSGFVMRDWRYVLAAELASIPALYLFIRIMGSL
jgi:O-antigen ligase